MDADDPIVRTNEGTQRRASADVLRADGPTGRAACTVAVRECTGTATAPF